MLKKDLYIATMLTKSQYRDAEVGMSSRVCNSKTCVLFSVWHGSLTANWRYECYSVVSSRRSELPRRTLAWLSQCVSTALRDAECRWTAVTASSLGDVGVRPCTAEWKSTEPCAWWPLFCTGCAVGQAASEETSVAVWSAVCAVDRWPRRRCFELLDDCNRSAPYSSELQ